MKEEGRDFLALAGSCELQNMELSNCVALDREIAELGTQPSCLQNLEKKKNL